MTAIETLLREPAAQAIGWALLHFAWQGTLIGILAAIALRLLQRSAADVRYVVSAIALALMGTMPLVTGWQAYRATTVEHRGCSQHSEHPEHPRHPAHPWHPEHPRHPGTPGTLSTPAPGTPGTLRRHPRHPVFPHRSVASNACWRLAGRRIAADRASAWRLDVGAADEASRLHWRIA